MDENTNGSTLPDPEQNASDALTEEQLNNVSGGGNSGLSGPSGGVELNHNQNVA